ncbi:MAG: TPM domain-containing protein [Bacteroidetes bacterium]|nr:MAG: TPM domain-containing protein [Bacteroidota bacterium]
MGLLSKDFLSEAEAERIVAAIREAEKNTSGEIRLHVEPFCKIEVMDRAADVFGFLDMHKTALRNGVLFYLAFEDHQFAILGDGGINQKVADNFWQETRDLVLNHFKSEQYTEGLVQGILHAGEQLKHHFPYQSDDKNELSDEISFG